MEVGPARGKRALQEVETPQDRGRGDMGRAANYTAEEFLSCGWIDWLQVEWARVEYYTECLW